MSRLTILSLMFMLLLGGCGLANQKKNDDANESEVTTQEDRKIIHTAVNDFNEKLTMTLMRGDAELAPTFEECYKNVSDAAVEFMPTIGLVQHELEGFDSPAGDRLVEQLLLTEENLYIILRDHGPDSSTSYEEFLSMVREVTMDIDVALNQYNN